MIGYDWRGYGYDWIWSGSWITDTEQYTLALRFLHWPELCYKGNSDCLIPPLAGTPLQMELSPPQADSQWEVQIPTQMLYTCTITMNYTFYKKLLFNASATISPQRLPKGSVLWICCFSPIQWIFIIWIKQLYLTTQSISNQFSQCMVFVWRWWCQ